MEQKGGARVVKLGRRVTIEVVHGLLRHVDRTEADIGLVYYSAGGHEVICYEGTCNSTLVRRRCFSARFDPFRSEFLNPAVNRGSSHTHARLSQQIHNDLIRQRIPQLPARSATDDVLRKSVVLEP